ncbi:MAG: hypothetical protein JWL59_1228 [Chthoniobacteraceae bacterium]|nr:hypothetical protein [Chthoniobacteraceae bacterium]
MDWIKKHYDQFALGVIALVLLGFSGFIAMKTFSFNQAFAALETVPQRNDKLPPLDLAPVAEAHEKLTKPVSWAPKKNSGSLFVSIGYIVDPNTGKLTAPGHTSSGGSLHPPVPDSYFLDNHLDLLSPTALEDDPDKDLFSNLDEYLNGGKKNAAGEPESTSPVDPKDHPPYYTKLYLEQWIKVPFLLLFQSVDGDPAKPETLTFGINPKSLKQPTEFLKIGETVRNTKFRVEKYEAKTAFNKKIEEEEDVSELTLKNTETGESVVLVVAKLTDSPDSYAAFTYIWPQPHQAIKVKKLQEFVLKPNLQEKFKVLDIKADHAVIALPGGGEYTVPLLKK